MEIYRTPDDRFDELPGYPFAPRYTEWEGLRMHHLDEGPPGAAPVLLLHGEPDWSYLYRKMIPVLAGRLRVVAPDYAGFGRSDKPTDVAWYTLDRHVESIRSLIDSLDLRGLTLVVQDWGGPIGLAAAVEMANRIARLVVLNTGLFSDAGWPTPGFLRWRRYAEKAGLDLPVGRVMQASTVTELDAATLAAYEAPWPVPESKAGVAAFPTMVPIDSGHPNAARLAAVAARLRGWDIPALVCWGTEDPVFTNELGQAMADGLPGAGGQVWWVEGAGHMLQEDRGEDIAARILEWAGASKPG